MKKAAVLTIFRVPNYGSVLQAYASQYLVERLGYDCVLIDYINPNEWHYSHGACRVRDGFFKRLAKYVAGFFAVFHRHHMRRRLDKFISRYLHLTSKYNSLDSLKQDDWSGYDVIIVGSDQVWNPHYQYGDSVFMLSFVPDNVRKVSLASSIALDKLPTTLMDKYRKYISRFYALSVRESCGKTVLSHQLGLLVPVRVLLDPTLLLSAREWETVLDVNSKRLVKQRYILLYLLTYAFNPRPYIYEVVNFFKSKYNCDVIVLGDNFEGMHKYVQDYKNMTGVTPQNFIRLFRDAECVVTSSFHGTAFALNFGKPLISVVGDFGDDRQQSLLNKLDVMNCCVPMGTPVGTLNPYYDCATQQEHLAQLRNADLNWFTAAMEI